MTPYLVGRNRVCMVMYEMYVGPISCLATDSYEVERGTLDAIGAFRSIKDGGPIHQDMVRDGLILRFRTQLNEAGSND